MSYSNNFDKLSTPLMVCSSDWKIVYKNRACKNFLPVPRCTNYINKYFAKDSVTLFPDKDSGINRIELKVKGSYKSSICFEYFGYAVILFPVLLEYEVFGFDNERFFDKRSADILRSMIAVLSDEDIQNEDRFHMLERVKRYVYGTLENSLAYSLLCAEERPLYPAEMLYKLIKDKVLSLIMKGGYRVQIDIDDLAEFGDMFLLDAQSVPLVFSNMLLFCLCVSKNKTCFAKVGISGSMIRNRIYFSVAEDSFGGEANSINDFIYGNPAEYLNVLPFECICNDFGWKVEYKKKNDGPFNACLSFDIGAESIDEFSSEEVLSRGRNYAQTVCAIVERIFAML